MGLSDAAALVRLRSPPSPSVRAARLGDAVSGQAAVGCMSGHRGLCPVEVRSPGRVAVRPGRVRVLGAPSPQRAGAPSRVQVRSASGRSVPGRRDARRHVVRGPPPRIAAWRGMTTVDRAQVLHRAGTGEGACESSGLQHPLPCLTTPHRMAGPAHGGGKTRHRQAPSRQAPSRQAPPLSASPRRSSARAGRVWATGRPAPPSGRSRSRGRPPRSGDTPPAPARRGRPHRARGCAPG